jgi:hypothetical protein
MDQIMTAVANTIALGMPLPPTIRRLLNKSRAERPTGDKTKRKGDKDDEASGPSGIAQSFFSGPAGQKLLDDRPKLAAVWREANISVRT